MTFLPWILWAVAAGALTLAAARALAARRRGEAMPMMSLIVAGFAFAAATAVAPFVGPVALPGSPAVQTTDAHTATTRLQAMQRQSQQLQTQVQKLQGDEATIQQQLDEPSGGAIQVPLAGSSRALILMGLLAALLVLEVGALLSARRLEAFAPEGLFIGFAARRDDQLVALDKLTELVWGERYELALAKAGEIVELKLRRSELLDLYYLRSYAAVKLVAAGTMPEGSDRETLLAGAIHDMESVVETTPKRGEATYLLGLALGFAGRDAEALEAFGRARKLLSALKLPFDQNESVCLLRQGEQDLSIGRTEAAEASFDRVGKLGKLGASVLNVRIRIAMAELRGAVRRGDIGAAEALFQKIAGFGLVAAQRADLEVTRIELTARRALQAKNPALADAETSKFLTLHLPSGLPPPDDAVVDEMFSPLLEADLTTRREVYRVFFFIQAIARCQTATQGRAGGLTEAQVAHVAEPLLRGLQFMPRDGDLLAAVGGLYYWGRRDLRAKAREWLDSAIMMGVDSRYARLIVAQDKAVEVERRGALDLFKSSSARFLRDPTLAAEVRRALVEELSRFQEFEPMLMSLQNRLELEPQEPTVATLRERGRHLARLLDSVSRQGHAQRHRRLSDLQADHVRALASLEQSAQELETLERRVIAELGESLVMT